MADILIEGGVQIAVTLLLTLIGVLGTWLTVKIGQREELRNINAAQQEAIDMARQTVGELQQTVVDGLKAAHKDGKLTKEEIANLGEALLFQTKSKMSLAAIRVLAAAAVDIDAIIKGAGEAWINKIK
jgi:vacuolar-type H+-ATPase subunit H